MSLVILKVCDVDGNPYANIVAKWTAYAIPEILSSELAGGVRK